MCVPDIGLNFPCSHRSEDETRTSRTVVLRNWLGLQLLKLHSNIYALSQTQRTMYSLRMYPVTGLIVEEENSYASESKLGNIVTDVPPMALVHWLMMSRDPHVLDIISQWTRPLGDGRNIWWCVKFWLREVRIFSPCIQFVLSLGHNNTTGHVVMAWGVRDESDLRPLKIISATERWILLCLQVFKAGVCVMSWYELFIRPDDLCPMLLGSITHRFDSATCEQKRIIQSILLTPSRPVACPTHCEGTDCQTEKLKPLLSFTSLMWRGEGLNCGGGRYDDKGLQNSKSCSWHIPFLASPETYG